MTSRNEYMWNKTLKFSWGHIIAFVALIFISYVAYMGAFYRNGGDFTEAAITVCVIDLFIFISFFGAQILKGSDEKLDRSLIIERILVILCPIVFLGAMVPYNHFWNVFSEREQIEAKFSESIRNSNKMFDDYEEYAANRINTYEVLLELHGLYGVTRKNYEEILRIQLLSQTESLREMARQWIKDADHGASVWNAFLVGNVDIISTAIEDWNKKLFEVSDSRLCNEQEEVQPFVLTHKSFVDARESLNGLKAVYTTTKGVNVNTIWSAVVLFLMLMFPYILQSRCTKASGLYHLLPEKLYAKKTLRRSNEKSVEDSSVENKSSVNDDIYTGTF